MRPVQSAVSAAIAARYPMERWLDWEGQPSVSIAVPTTSNINGLDENFRAACFPKCDLGSVWEATRAKCVLVNGGAARDDSPVPKALPRRFGRRFTFSVVKTSSSTSVGEVRFDSVNSNLLDRAHTKRRAAVEVDGQKSGFLCCARGRSTPRSPICPRPSRGVVRAAATGCSGPAPSVPARSERHTA